IAAEQDYLLVLYDDWDSRMEAATVFLAARVGRPVVVYDEGWCGRIVGTYNCGVRVSRLGDTADFFRTLPRPADHSYQALVEGMAEFARAHSGETARAAFLAKLIPPVTAA